MTCRMILSTEGISAKSQTKLSTENIERDRLTKNTHDRLPKRFFAKSGILITLYDSEIQELLLTLNLKYSATGTLKTCSASFETYPTETSSAFLNCEPSFCQRNWFSARENRRLLALRFQPRTSDVRIALLSFCADRLEVHERPFL